MFRSIVSLNRNVLEKFLRQNFGSKNFYLSLSHAINEKSFVQTSNSKNDLGSFCALNIRNYSVKKGIFVQKKKRMTTL